MEYQLPSFGKKAVDLIHFPSSLTAFIFRAYEYVPPVKIAEILGTTEENVRCTAEGMGLKHSCTSDIWLVKGYITVIRRMWHILPYEQLLDLLGIDNDTLAVILREEDFLDIKLQDKPVCNRLEWRELTEEELRQMESIRHVVETVDLDGATPFDFRYDVRDMKLAGKKNFELRMIYGFSGLYQHAFDVDSRTYCPDAMLEAYQKVGINAIWTQGILYQLSEFPFDTELSSGYQERIARLRDLSERCDKYGIKIFLYLNEPRCMPESLFDKYPELRGHNAGNDKVCMCTSVKAVRDYITDSVSFICRQVPKIGGFFSITRSENYTNCYSHTKRDTCNCRRCKDRSESEVIAEVIGCIERGAHRVDPDIKVIAYTWAWIEFSLDIIKALPDHVVVMSVSERQAPFTIGGISGEVKDYSMSVLGPGPVAKAEWKAARERGLELAAKVQVNTTWEGSTVPAIPVYPLVEEHIRRVREEGVDNLMLSWTLGGYPSQNIMHAAKYFCEHYDELALAETESQRRAVALFCDAFQEFPFHVRTLYNGPQNGGPANLLFLKPTGYCSTMTCYAYDDFDNWRSIYPREVFQAQLERLCGKWKQGLEILERERLADSDAAWGELEVMASAAYCLFRSSLNQFRFYLARENCEVKTMLRIAQEESVCARKMLELMNRNAAIGFEAANHYFFSKGCLLEKILNCGEIIRRLTEDGVYAIQGND